MPKRRAIDTDYSRHTIEDRPEEVDSLRFLNEDGELVEGGEANPLPVSQTDDSKTRTEDLDDKLARVVSLLEKLCIYAESITEIGMEGIEEDADY